MTRREQITEAADDIGMPTDYGYGFIAGAEWADKTPENQIIIKESWDKSSGKEHTAFVFNYEGSLEEFTREMKSREDKLKIAIDALQWYATPGIHERWKAEEALAKIQGESLHTDLTK